ncbi:PEBP-like protein [Laetiporus sulphureus 93-53]|uniref:PEBP-like protein n=1 Tax=Laetiporus sulphureus 93-53 TaxID=1314785 RepID=A0A165FHB7_9APHY|nr:PEBP-like protein [Laetiporus sulphureus 93-53]KZT08971.1 PEBP-like protein [Laetiporus sulphureus 93-53]
MLAVRRLPRIRARLSGIRSYASLEAVSTPSDSVNLPPPSPPQADAPEPQAQKAAETGARTAEQETSQGNGEQTQRQWPTRRPRISLANPRDWNRPIAKGVLPAYDFASEYIREDSKALKKELAELRKDLAAAESLPESDRDVQVIEALKEKEKILKIQSEVNLPEVRWRAFNGLGNMKKAVYRHLLEQRWREDGPLDLLMERIHQMSVVPDLLPSLHPTLDLRVNFPEPPPKRVDLRRRVKHKYKKVEPGIFLLPQQTLEPPMLYTSVFHVERRLYTMLMVDLDIPDEENQTFTTFLHWMQPNISLSATSPSPIPLSSTHTPYIPPHPQRGTRYHRYVILILPQADPTTPIDVPVANDAERMGFDFRAFAETFELDGATGGGAHMWREVWDETVSKIYQDVLKTEEPRYGQPPKPDRYAHLKEEKRYS